MNKFMMLIKRECWEQRAGFIYMPLVITGLSILFVVLLLLKSYDLNSTGIFLPPMGFEDGTASFESGNYVSGLEELAAISLEQKESFYSLFLTGIGGQFLFVMGIMLIMYFINCLYQDRKDRSVLFWKSMPVSDGITVASKMVAGLVVAPLIYFACMMLAHFLVLLCISIFALTTSVELWASIWQPSNIFAVWFSLFADLVKILALYVPLSCWLILVSAGSKTSPLGWAIGVPLVLVIVEDILFEVDVVGGFVHRAFFPFDLNVNAEHPVAEIGYGLGLEFVLAMLVSAGFIAGAIYLRKRAGEL